MVQDYPATHFGVLIAHLQQPLHLILINALFLLARRTATLVLRAYNPFSPYRTRLVGLDSTALLFYHTYLEYLCVTNATEHVLLAFVRWQDAPSNESSGLFGGRPGSAASLSVPMPLKDGIRGP
jgi:hypothetical protein